MYSQLGLSYKTEAFDAHFSKYQQSLETKIFQSKTSIKVLKKV